MPCCMPVFPVVFNTGVIETAPRTLLSMAPLFGGPQIPFIVEPEFLLAYEIGVKTTWLNGALQLNAAIFRNEFDDQQVNQGGKWGSGAQKCCRINHRRRGD